MGEIKGTGVRQVKQHSYLNRLIRGSMIAFIATPRPTIETKKAVIFSIRALAFEVAGWTELKSFSLICVITFFAKMNISLNP